MSKLLQLKSENVRESTHAQRLYKRRKNTNDGYVISNWSMLGTSALDGTAVESPTTNNNNNSNNGGSNIPSTDCECGDNVPVWSGIIGKEG